MTSSSTAKVLLGLMTTLALSAGALAETRWLSDELWVNLRAGASDGSQVLQTISSGTRMETLGESENGYINVRTETGHRRLDSASLHPDRTDRFTATAEPGSRTRPAAAAIERTGAASS